MSYETDNWKLIQAKWFGVKRTVPVDLIVIHDMEFPEKLTAAEDIGAYFANPGKKANGEPNKVSSTIGVDPDSIIQYVKDSFVAFAAPGANHNGIQIELAGYGRQTTKEWLDHKGGISILNLGADATAQYSLKYDVPLVKLTPSEIRAGKRGVCGHADVSLAFGKSDHTDPGLNFPWEYFMCAARTFRRVRI